MALTPTFGRLSLEEGAYLLQGLAAVDLQQLRSGTPGILRAISPGTGMQGLGQRRIQYRRRDPAEHWQTIGELWRSGGGDCEDLAAATAAELVYHGIPARPVVRRVRPGLAHALVQLGDGSTLDPSKVAGMGEPDDLAGYEVGDDDELGSVLALASLLKLLAWARRAHAGKKVVAAIRAAMARAKARRAVRRRRRRQAR